MRRNRAACAFSVALILVLLLILPAFTACREKTSGVPEPPEGFFVLDSADVLSADTEKYVVSGNEGLPEGAQIVVVCVKDTGRYPIDEYAAALFNKWGIGDAKKGNGLLVLLSVGADDYWITEGKGLEDLLPSGQLKLILNEYLEPYFAEKQYDAGVRAVFDALRHKLTQIYGVKTAA